MAGAAGADRPLFYLGVYNGQVLLSVNLATASKLSWMACHSTLIPCVLRVDKYLCAKDKGETAWDIEYDDGISLAGLAERYPSSFLAGFVIYRKLYFSKHLGSVAPKSKDQRMIRSVLNRL